MTTMEMKKLNEFFFQMIKVSFNIIL